MEQKTNELTMAEKLIAVGTITGNYEWFDRTEAELTEHQKDFVQNTLLTHSFNNGYHGVVMAAKVGKAIIASMKHPIKPKTGIVQTLKNKVKELLS